MSTYFEVRNDKNILQIDDTYMNLVMTRKVRAKIAREPFTLPPPNYGQTEVCVARVRLRSDEVLAAAIPSRGEEVGFVVTQINREIVVYADENYAFNHQDLAFDVYVFGTNAPKTYSGQGLEIYDADGKIVFSSAYKYMNVVASRVGSIHVTQQDSTSYRDKFDSICQIPRGRKYAVVQGVYPWCFWDFNPQGHRAGIFCAKQKDNAIGVSFMPLHMTGWQDLYTPFDAYEEFDGACSYTVIDVTNY